MSAINDAAFAAAYQYMREQKSRGATEDQIAMSLVEQGWEPDIVMQMIANIRHEPVQPAPTVNYASAYASPAKKAYASSGGGGGGADMVVGGLICAVGLIVTIGSYMSASGGGTYVVAWGAILFGGIRFFRGLVSN